MSVLLRSIFVIMCLISLSGCLKDRFVNLSPYWVGQLNEGNGESEVSVVNFGLRKTDSTYRINFQLFQNSSTKKPEIISVRFKDDNSIWFSWSDRGMANVALKVEGSCARSSSPQVEFCFQENELRAFVVSGEFQIRLKLSKPSQKTEKSEKIEKLRLDQLVGCARMRNFSSLKEAERVYQAKESIREARGNLLPRFNTRSLFAYVTTGPLGLIDTIGELLPFVFPTQWLKWSQSKDLYQAELNSFASLVGNEMNAVELMALSIHRDIEISNFFKVQLNFLESIEKKAKSLEELGVVKPGGSLDFSLKVRAYQQDQRQLQGLLERQLAELAYASGFAPVATTIELEKINFDEPALPELSPIEISDVVKNRSMEIETLNFLVKASDKDVGDRQFGFLDPSSQRSFGFGYASSIRIGRSHQRELEIERDSIRNLLEKRVVAVISDTKEAYDLYVSATNATKDAQTRFDQLVTIPFELGEISWAQPQVVPLILEAIDNRLKYESMRISALHAFELARAKMDRLTLSGFYEGLGIK